MGWFDEAVDYFDRMRQTEWGRATIGAFIDFIDPEAGWSALDVGCGAGNLAMALARRVRRVDGIDQSAPMVQRAKEHCAESGLGNCSFRVGGADAIPFSDSVFDLVTTSAVLYLVADQAIAATEMARVVRPGGVIALHEPTPDMSVGRMRAFLDERRRSGVELPDLTGWARAAESHAPLDEDGLADLFDSQATLVSSRRRFDGMAIEAKLVRAEA